MKTQWILLALIVVIAAGLAASWGLGFWDEPPVPGAAPPEPAARSARKEPPPLDTAAWMLAHSQAPQAASAQPAHADDDSACGVSHAQCPDDSSCIDGTCLQTACSADGGSGGRVVACALAGRKAGSCCGERCVDLGADSASCGRCDIACDRGLDCVSGHCEARSCTGQMAATSCVARGGGRGACCRGECIDQTSWARDAANCGGCGHACAPGLSCERGACTDPATGAPPAWNCFERGHTCPEDSFCVVDACYPKACSGESDGMLCPGLADGQIGHCCDQVCTDLFSDANNCRACGLRCNSGEVCRNGECGAK